MQFCQPHWEALRAAIEARGLSALVAEGGEAAARNLARELEDGPSIDSYDPLMSAHFGIWSNAMRIAKEAGADPLFMLRSDPEHPEWECPVCFLNEMSRHHDARCVQPECDKGVTFDWMIERAADEEVKAWEAMRP